MNQKGQESAVFELLIAIIIMGFVIVIGFNALKTLEEKTCEGTLNQNLEDIRSAIENVVKTKSKVNISFNLPTCYPEKNSILRIIDRDSAQFCSAICEGSVRQCTILNFSSPEYTIAKCLRISSATNFADPTNCDPRILDGSYEAVAWKSSDGIKPGDYTLIRESSIFSQAPVICVYRKK
ncbi:MAG: hypothetical protein QXU92_03490 [Candidatus Diapherotrites archaeon]